MNYNDIKSRLDRTLSSLNTRFDEDIDYHTNIEFWENGKGLSITFGNLDEAEVLNRIMTILHNLASLKDHLKNCLQSKGHNPQIVEHEINNSLHLQVLIDIINQEKHGSPLKRPRSNKNPVIRYPEMGYRPFFKVGGSVMDEIPEDYEGPGSMVITALIKDENENLLFRLDELVETCFSIWHSLAKEHGCI
jgi:hypothetical protein